MRWRHSVDKRVVAAYDVVCALQLTYTNPMRATQVRGSCREVPEKRLRQLAGTHLSHIILVCVGNSRPVCALMPHEMHRTVKLLNGGNIRANHELNMCGEVPGKDQCA